jgi:hypothetical protein
VAQAAQSSASRRLTRRRASRPAIHRRSREAPHGPEIRPAAGRVEWLGTRGLLGLFLAAFTTVLRALLGFDETRRQVALSFAAALFAIGFVAPGVSEPSAA